MVLSVLLSYWLGAIYDLTESVWACALTHGLTNTLLSMVVLSEDSTFLLGIVLLTIISIWFSKTAHERRKRQQEGLEG